MPSTNSGIQLQDRDFELLRGLFESRIMLLRHIAAIHFEGHKEAAKKRVQRLKKAGFIGERARSPQEPAVLSLTRKAFEALRQRGMLEGYPRMQWMAVAKRIGVSDLTLHHELAVMDVKASFYTAAYVHRTTKVLEFSTWPELLQFNAFHPTTNAKITVKPDGFIRLQEARPGSRMTEHLFFLELDRSTETLDVLSIRAICYRNYYRQGGFVATFQRERTTYKEHPFRVLIVCNTTARQRNIAARLLDIRPPIRRFVWLTTFDEIIIEPFRPIVSS